MFTNFRTYLYLVFFIVSASACVPSAFAFSFGIRPFAGVELVTIPSSTLVDAETAGNKLSDDKNIQRRLICYGGDILVTPLELKAFSLSTSVGFRATKSDLASGAVQDTLKLNYVPIGLSADFAFQKLRLSGYANYDIGIGSSLNLSVPDPSNSVDIKLSKLSRVRFGALAEFFILNSLGLFASFDYAIGSYESGSGPLSLKDSGSDGSYNVMVASSQNKLTGMTIVGGLSYYFAVPASQKPVTAGKNNLKPALKKHANKPSAKKVIPDGGGSSSAIPQGSPPAE